MKKPILSAVIILMLLVSQLIPIFPLSANAALEMMLNVNWNNISKVGSQNPSGQACGCYALAYCRTILDGYVHYWSEYDRRNGVSESSAYSDWGKGGYKSSVTYTEKSLYQITYNSINSGRPIIIHVYNPSGKIGNEHWVTVVGYTGVSDYNSLTADNFLIIDPGTSASLNAPLNLGSSRWELLNQDGNYAYRYTESGCALENQEPPSDVVLSKNQYWYDIKDTVTLTAISKSASTYWISILQDGNSVVNEQMSGDFSIQASELGYGDYHAWVSAVNSSGSTDSNHLDFSIVGSPAYLGVNSQKSFYDTTDTVLVSVDSICAKGHVIGIDKEGEGRVLTEECDSQFEISAESLGVGEYSAYFSVYNGSGSIDTSRVHFTIYDSAPTWGTLEIVNPKSSYNVGDIIELKASSDFATEFWLGLNKNSTRYLTEEMIEGQYSFELTEAGEYSAYVSAANGLGYVDSPKIYFNVYNPFTVTFNANGGECSTEKIIVKYNEIYGELPIPTKDGYRFIGWYTSESSGNLIEADSVVDITDNQTLYARWESVSLGDANADGDFTVADVVMLQKWLLGAGNLTNWQNADLYEDGIIDVFDLVMMKRKLIYG